MNKDTEKDESFIREVFSENGYGASKRVFGALGIIGALFVMVWLAVKEGGTDSVKDIVETIIISSISLLGISSVTGIFKKGSSDNDGTEQQ